MDKNKLIKIVIKEIQELESAVKGLSDKIDNLKSLIEILQEEEIAEVKEIIELKEVTEIEPLEEKKPVIAEPALEISVEQEVETVIKKEPEIVIEIPPVVVINNVEIPTPSAEKKTEKKSILADTIKTTSSSLNEKLSENLNQSLDKALSNQKITDLKRSISLNDKFRFQREIFGGNAALLNQTLEALNEIENKEEAMEFLSNLNFDNENTVVTEFLELVNRKFL